MCEGTGGDEGQEYWDVGWAGRWGGRTSSPFALSMSQSWRSNGGLYLQTRTWGR
jgi:hypothetical protein